MHVPQMSALHSTPSPLSLSEPKVRCTRLGPSFQLQYMVYVYEWGVSSDSYNTCMTATDLLILWWLCSDGESTHIDCNTH